MFFDPLEFPPRPSSKEPPTSCGASPFAGGSKIRVGPREKTQSVGIGHETPTQAGLATTLEPAPPAPAMITRAAYFPRALAN